MAQVVTTTVEGQIFWHRHIWRVVIRQMEQAKSNPIGSFYEHLVAMVFTFNTLEGYLNYVGGQLQPDLWKNERNTQEINTLKKKLRKVFVLCELPDVDLSASPYGSIDHLQTLRDKIAHPKVESYKKTIKRNISDLDESRHYVPDDFLVSHDMAIRAVDDVSAICSLIHKAARSKITDVWFGREWLDGSLSHAEHRSTVSDA